METTIERRGVLFHKVKEDFYAVHVGKVKIGELLKEVDGYFVFYLTRYNGGAFASHILMAIAEELDEVNRPWVDQVRKAVLEHALRPVDSTLDYLEHEEYDSNPKRNLQKAEDAGQ